MTKIYQVLLAIHIIAGGTCLLSGTIALISKKGQKVHLKSGMVFFYGMLLVALSALTMTFIKANQFLLCISLFALFQNYFGYRAKQQKNLYPSAFDWIVLSVSTINGIFMLTTGNIVMIVFGALNTSLVIRILQINYLHYKKIEPPKLMWLKRHIGMMIGAFIATITAFLVVNITSFEPAWLPWLMPTFVLVPLIFYFNKKFVSPKKKKSGL